MTKETQKQEFNSKVFTKLMATLKPYWLWVLIALSAMGLATLGDLSVPVIIQQTLDRQILGEYRLIPEAVVLELKELGYQLDFLQRDDSFLLSNSDWEEVAGPQRQELLERFGVFPRGILASQGELEGEDQLAGGENWSLMSRESFQSLGQEQRAQLREADIQVIFRQAGIMGAILLGVLLMSFAQVLILTWTSQRVMKDLRMKLFGHFLGQSQDFHNTTPQGKIVGGVTNDVATISEFFNTLFTSLLRDLVMMSGALITLFILDSQLASWTMLILPPVLIILFVFRYQSRKASRRVRSHVSDLNTYLSEHLSGMKVVQMFGREKATGLQFSKVNNQLRDSYLKEMQVAAFFRPLLDFLSSVAIGILIWFGGTLFGLELVSIGVLIAFINLIQKFFFPLNSVAENFSVLQSALAGAERIFGFLDEKKSIPNQGNETPNNQQRLDIRFENVSFHYKKDEPVLRDLSFLVPHGSVTALVGYTGSGKTTITNLLTRFWDPQEGQIFLGELPLTQYALKELRSNVQSVLQDVVLFSGSVKENITLGRDIDKNKIEEVCRQVQAHGFISKLPQGYDTQLQEGGSNLSAGQRQLLSFARVLLQDPKILLLDEATANIDSETEDLIQKALEVLLEGRTVVVVAHRLSTIRRANQILVLDRGKIIEKGTHDQLMDQKGFYHSLYRLQLEEGEIQS